MIESNSSAERASRELAARVLVARRPRLDDPFASPHPPTPTTRTLDRAIARVITDGRSRRSFASFAHRPTHHGSVRFEWNPETVRLESRRAMGVDGARPVDGRDRSTVTADARVGRQRTERASVDDGTHREIRTGVGSDDSRLKTTTVGRRAYLGRRIPKSRRHATTRRRDDRERERERVS